jgi:MFS family permease
LSKGSIVGRIRGLYLTIINSAWVFAQIFSGKVLSGLSFSFFYLMASGIMFLFLLIILINFKNTPDPNYDKLSIFKSIRKFFKNKTLARSYRINFLLQFFYSWMVIYTPLYLFAHLGFTWKEISVIFTIMLLPFVLIQFPLGQHSDKVGERKIMMIGFFIISLTTMSLFFITKHSVWIWALALFGTRLGAATVEVMSDAYFFKHINKENDEFIGVYRNTGPMAYILAPLLASGLFFIIPDFNFIFLILGALMLFGVYTASTIRKDDI